MPVSPSCTLDRWLSRKAQEVNFSFQRSDYSPQQFPLGFNVSPKRGEMFVLMYMLTFWMLPGKPPF